MMGALILLSSCWAVSAVVELNRTSFDSLVSADKHLWMVEFYSSEKMPVEEAFAEAADSLEAHGVRFGAVDLDVKANAKLAKKYNVVKVPHILVFSSLPVHNAYTGKMFREALQYTGARDKRGLRRFASKAMPNFFVRLGDGDAKESGPTVKKFVDAKGKAHRGLASAVLVTRKEKMPPLWKAISADFHDRIRLGHVVKSDSAVILAAVGVDEEEAPALVAFGAEGARAQYAGDLKDKSAIASFLTDYAAAAPVPVVAKGSAAKEAAKAAARIGGATVLASADDFERSVLNSTAAWVVVYIDGPPAKEGAVEKAIAKASKKAIKSYGGGLDAQVAVGVVDCVAAKALGGVKGVPCPKKREADGDGLQRATARLFPFGEKERTGKKSKGKPLEIVTTLDETGEESFDGEGTQSIDVMGAVADAAAQLPERIVQLMPDPQAVQQFMSAAVQQGQLAIIVLHKKATVPAMMKAVALNKVVAKVAQVSFVSKPSKDMVKGYGLTKLPAILVGYGSEAPSKPGDPPLEDGAKRLTLQLSAFDPRQFGGFSYTAVVNFVIAVGQQAQTPSFQALVEEEQAKAAAAGGDAGGAQQQQQQQQQGGDAGASVEEVELVELSAENFETTCSGRKMCLIAVLQGADPTVDGASEATTSVDAAQLAVVRKTHAKKSSAIRGLGMAYLDGQCNHEFAKRFGLGDGDLPTLVALSTKHGVYSKFVGSWSSAKVSAFIGSAVAGRKATSKLLGDGPVELAARDCVAQYKQTSAEIAAADAGSAADSQEDDEWLAEIRAEEAAAAKALDDELEAQAAAEKKAGELAVAKEKEDAKNAERQALIDAERARRKAKRKAKKKKKKKKKGKK